ncbi:MAG: BsuPI-related putative proteinase inhibitor [Hyalangium sp.]|uniref:BsuPI-related putative proteinase inhibitor n=1 Tax=Hyalangium sp. TaxID=2028555 RepID=UPI00389A0C77
MTLALCAALAPVSQAQAADPLSFQFTADKAGYTRSEQAVLTIQVKNTSALPLVINFSNGQQYDFAARDASGATVWTWSTGKSFDPSGSQRVLAAGETWTLQETWAFVTDGGQGVLDGSYTVSGTFLGNYVGKTGSKSGEQAVTLTTPDALQVTFTTDKSSYGRLDTATLTLTVTNTAPYALTVDFNSAQLYDFSATSSSGTTVWSWSNGKTFDPTPQEIVLAPGESRQYQTTWGLTQNNGLAAPSGTYTVRGTFLGIYYGQQGTKDGAAQIQIRPLL